MPVVLYLEAILCIQRKYSGADQAVLPDKEGAEVIDAGVGASVVAMHGSHCTVPSYRPRNPGGDLQGTLHRFQLRAAS